MKEQFQVKDAVNLMIKGMPDNVRIVQGCWKKDACFGRNRSSVKETNDCKETFVISSKYRRPKV